MEKIVWERKLEKKEAKLHRFEKSKDKTMLRPPQQMNNGCQNADAGTLQTHSYSSYFTIFILQITERIIFRRKTDKQSFYFIKKMENRKIEEKNH